LYDWISGSSFTTWSVIKYEPRAREGRVNCFCVHMVGCCCCCGGELGGAGSPKGSVGAGIMRRRGRVQSRWKRLGKKQRRTMEKRRRVVVEDTWGAVRGGIMVLKEGFTLGVGLMLPRLDWRGLVYAVGGI
jgi:hypothetical protein